MQTEDDVTNAYINILTHCKGLQSGQIVPLPGLFGRFVILRSESYLCYRREGFRVRNGDCSARIS